MLVEIVLYRVCAQVHFLLWGYSVEVSESISCSQCCEVVSADFLLCYAFLTLEQLVVLIGNSWLKLMHMCIYLILVYL